LVAPVLALLGLAPGCAGPLLDDPLLDDLLWAEAPAADLDAAHVDAALIAGVMPLRLLLWASWMRGCDEPDCGNFLRQQQADELPVDPEPCVDRLDRMWQGRAVLREGEGRSEVRFEGLQLQDGQARLYVDGTVWAEGEASVQLRTEGLVMQATVGPGRDQDPTPWPAVPVDLRWGEHELLADEDGSWSVRSLALQDGAWLGLDGSGGTLPVEEGQGEQPLFGTLDLVGAGQQQLQVQGTAQAPALSSSAAPSPGG